MKKTPRNLLARSMYDFANSTYATVFQSFLLPGLLSTVFLQAGFSLTSWGVANAAATIGGSLLGVGLGRLADGSMKRRLQLFSLLIILAFIGMIILSYTTKGSYNAIWWAYVLTNGVYLASLALYHSFLPHLAESEDKKHTYSGFAWGLGYVGGIAGLLVALLLQRFLGTYHYGVFLSVAVFYGLFSAYTLWGLRKYIDWRHVENTQERGRGESVERAETIVGDAVRGRSWKRIAWLLFGYRCISEVITVVFSFFATYGTQELGLSSGMLGVILLVAQLIAFPATRLGSKYVARIGSMRYLGLNIIGWVVTVLALVADIGMIGVCIFVVSGGLVMGNTQSFFRSQYSHIIPESQSGRRFGIYSLVAQAASSVGPVLYGLMSDGFGSQKIPLVVFLMVMVIGYVIVWRVTNRRGSTDSECAV